MHLVADGCATQVQSFDTLHIVLQIAQQAAESEDSRVVEMGRVAGVVGVAIKRDLCGCQKQPSQVGEDGHHTIERTVRHIPERRQVDLRHPLHGLLELPDLRLVAEQRASHEEGVAAGQVKGGKLRAAGQELHQGALSDVGVF